MQYLTTPLRTHVAMSENSQHNKHRYANAVQWCSLDSPLCLNFILSLFILFLYLAFLLSFPSLSCQSLPALIPLTQMQLGGMEVL